MGVYAEQISFVLSDSKLYRWCEKQYIYYRTLELLIAELAGFSANSVAIWGGNSHAVWLKRGLPSDIWKKITFIFDKNISEDRFGLGKIYTSDIKLFSYNIDAVIIAAYQDRDEIRKELYLNYPSMKVVDIYELMKKDNLPISSAFFFYAMADYPQISFDLQVLNEKGPGAQNENIKRLIGDYFSIRDFVYAFQYIDLLDLLDDEEREFYSQVRINLEYCLARISEKVSEGEHIVIHWIDSLRPEESFHMPFLSSLRQEGMYFKDAHTVAPYTSATLKTIFTGKYYLDDYLFNLNDLTSLEDSELYRIFSRRGYLFKYFGAKSFDGIFFNEKTYPLFLTNIHSYLLPSSVLQFELLNELEESSKKTFAIIMYLTETHPPFFNGIQTNLMNMDGDKELYMSFGNPSDHNRNRIMSQIRMGQYYLDSELRFYYKIIANGCFRSIIMSDHGQYRGESPMCVEGYSHIFFLILGNDITARTVDDIFSLVYFPELMENLITETSMDIEPCLHQYALLQTDDCYSEEVFRRLVVCPEAYKGLYVQHRGVVTKDDVYLRLISGEEYYIQRGTAENRIRDEQYQEQIDKLRMLTGNRFINVYGEDKYCFSRKLYKMFGISPDKRNDYF